MPTTCGIAAHDPFAKIKIHDEDALVNELPVSESHFAVLAFDGDKMGERISRFKSVGEHKSFGETLATFALEKVSPLVESHLGRVIYAGGDDVLALLPADTALACAEQLKKAFGETAGCKASVGIAIAHFKSPLQDIVRAAQSAEKRAKRPPEQGGFGRDAVAVTIYARSGEAVEWGCKWDSGGLELFRTVGAALEAGKLTAKFPQRVIELLAPYLDQQTKPGKNDPGFEKVVDEIIQCEFAAVCDRQRGTCWTKEVPKEILPGVTTFLSKLAGQGANAQTKLRAVIGLCQTAAFARRTRNKDAVSEARTAETITA